MLQTAPRASTAAADSSIVPNDREGQALALWASRHAAVVAQGTARSALVDVAVALVLDQLRACLDGPALLERYQDHRRDRELLEHLLPATRMSWYDVRDAAFYLRWIELVSGGPPNAA